MNFFFFEEHWRLQKGNWKEDQKERKKEEIMSLRNKSLRLFLGRGLGITQSHQRWWWAWLLGRGISLGRGRKTSRFFTQAYLSLFGEKKNLGKNLKERSKDGWGRRGTGREILEAKPLQQGGAGEQEP